jgi:3D (Asp-Asp-Asp) domain-containing protein
MNDNRFYAGWLSLALILILVWAFNGWATQKITEIEADMAEIEAELEELRAKPSPTVFIPEPITTYVEPVFKDTYLGEFSVSAFCPCPKCCGKWSNPENPITASGAPAIEGITVGADWSTIPKGTVVYIEGVGERIVQDKPAKWIVEKYDGKILDLYFESHKEALNFGRQNLRVWARG